MSGRGRPVRHRPKPLLELAELLGRPVTGPPPGPRLPGVPVVTGVSEDSREVRAGDLYLALPGARWHGARFAAEAVARGAVAAVSDRVVPGLATVVVPDPRAVAGLLSAWVYDDPSHHLAVYGVTGTNGKTSTTHLLHAALGAAGRLAGLVSGIEVRGPAGARPGLRTTPEADELQAELASMREAGAAAAAVEVSSHGLALHRVAGTRFAAAVFTNLGPDHLDLHGDLEAYYAAKASLFAPHRCALAVVGTDDPFGRRLAAEAAVPVVTFSTGGRDADFRALDVRADQEGTSFSLRGPGLGRRVRLRLLGAHQADNALAAVAALVSTGVEAPAVLRGVQRLAQVPGRLERVDAGQPFLAFVDHAHNTSGQERLFPYLRSLTRGRLHVVLGITGERDPGKRAPLGATAAAHADTVVVTDESAHSEDPALLREEVAAGARGAGRARVVVEPDRAGAIALAVASARAGDVVVVTGRGCDQHLVTGDRVQPFDDRTALRAALHRSLHGSLQGAPHRRSA